MSDGGRERASLGMKIWKSFQKWGVQRSAVRSIAWLGLVAHADLLFIRLPALCALVEAYLRSRLVE
jgi:hypothetical protein